MKYCIRCTRLVKDWRRFWMSYAIINMKKKKIFSNIEVNEICDELEIKIPEFKENKQRRVAEKISKILKKYKVNNIVLSNEFENLTSFENVIMQNNNYIIKGKRLYKVLIPKTINDVSHMMNFEKTKLNIGILVDEYNADNIELIKIISDEVKNVSIITNNAYRFEQLVDELLKSKGIVVQLLNKGKINLKRKHLIVNLDFSSMDIEKLNVPNECILITNSVEPQKMKNGFNGIVIRDIDIFLNKKNEKYRSLELCEAYIYNHTKRIKENTLLFNRSTYKINGYIGNNGKIEQEDFERLGKIFVRNKKQTVKNNT